MKATKQLVSIVVLGLFSVAGCMDDDPVDVAQTTAAPEAQSETPPLDRFQDIIDIYTQSLLDRDAKTLSPILSTEVLWQADHLGKNLGDLIEKQRASMQRTLFLAENDRPRFLVTNVVAEGDRYAVTLSYEGRELTKPTYFVREGDDIKLNVAVPGFSRNYRSTSSYQVHNTNFGGDPTTMMCDPNNLATWPGETKSVSCTDHCGWFSGTKFQRYGGTVQRNCDWNSWGDDVVVNLNYTDGWACNDLC